MLNRTNRTLSAHLNRLNLGLGTRSVALVAIANNGKQTLRTRYARFVVMRDGMMGSPGDRIPDSIPAIASIPCSAPEPLRPSAACRERSRSGRVVDVARLPVAEPVVAVRPSWPGESRPWPALPFGTKNPKPCRQPFFGQRQGQRSQGRACVTARATVLVAAGG
jgi:hypothetical protein